MEILIAKLPAWLDRETLLTALRFASLVAVGLVLARVAGRGVGKLLAGEVDAHREQLLRRVVSYATFGLFGAAALHQIGFDLRVLLGAAGILSVAVGFASQTSASNLVSGLFLLGEHPFGVGDVVRVGQTTGEVVSVDLLSMKLRTFDNLFVRIPNETLIKSEVTNLTRYPIRRIDIAIGVAYKENVERVRDLLLEIADQNPLALEEPPPLFIFSGYGDSALQLQFSVWGARENFLELRNTIQHEIKEAFDRAGIEIPFPHRSLYAGAATDPLPVRLVSGHDGFANPRAGAVPPASA